MKRILIVCGLAAALLGLSQNASAQYASQIHRDGTAFMDDRGVSLSDAELVQLIGPEIYYETVVGARKQYRAGRKLITGGAIGAGAGFLGVLTGTYLMMASTGESFDSFFDDFNDYPDWHHDRSEDAYMAMTGAFLFVGGYAAAILGSLALEAGIPLKIIGQSRLNWVENNYNDRNRDAYFRFGFAPSGVGLTLNF